MLCLRQNPFVHLHAVFVYYHQRLKLSRYVGKYAHMMGHSKMDSEVIVQVGFLASPQKRLYLYRDRVGSLELVRSRPFIL